MTEETAVLSLETEPGTPACTARTIDTVSGSILAVMLLLSALAFLFVFTINWEDWFFGMKLDGLPAGLYLFAKGGIAAGLFFAMVKYPGHVLAVTALATIYYGYLLADSSVIVQARTGGFFSPLLLAMFLVAAASLVIHVTTWYGHERSG
jgi:hypothetical protein